MDRANTSTANGARRCLRCHADAQNRYRAKKYGDPGTASVTIT